MDGIHHINEVEKKNHTISINLVRKKGFAKIIVSYGENSEQHKKSGNLNS